MNSKIIVSNTTHSLNCMIYYPNMYTDLPLLVYLHGAGERGKRIDHVNRHGVPKLINEGKEIPAVVLCPQCPENLIWNNIVEEVRDIISDVVERFNIKHDRIVITGSSMGGYGTWEMAMCYPEIFAAAAPISGGGVTFRAEKLKNVPIRAYHGEKDGVVEYTNSKLMVDAVNKFGGNAELITLKDMGHNDAIDYAYRSTDLISWLLKIRKSDFSYISEPCADFF